MFGRKDNEGETDTATMTTATMAQDVTVQNAGMQRPTLGDPSRVPGVSGAPLPGRRVMEKQRRPSSERMHGGPEYEERKLIVGKGLSLSGEIAACDVLVVEGKVEAKLSDGKLLEITETGQFRGGVEIENADIAGRYDGELTVHGRLTIRGTGRISGIVKYGELEVNAGGQIIGEMQVVGGGAGASTGNGKPSFKNAAKFAASPEEEEPADALFSRKTVNG